jgi:hypothetical protein
MLGAVELPLVTVGTWSGRATPGITMAVHIFAPVAADQVTVIVLLVLNAEVPNAPHRSPNSLVVFAAEITRL